jgi:chorismate dehydratase
MRVGCIPYLHAEPFYFDMQRRGIELHELVPSAVSSAIMEGEIDAGPVPLVDCFRLQDALQTVAGVCVATVRHANSVLFYSPSPIAELDGARIGITDEAVTAPQLLDVILRLQFGVQPAAYVSLHETYDAFLLIGNQALRQRMGAPGFPYTYDLGAVWHAWTGLPFVFSRWMVRQDIAPREVALLTDTLYVGLEAGVDALFGLAEPREELLMLPRDVARYLQGFRYYIGLNEQQAMDRFRHCLQQLQCA